MSGWVVPRRVPLVFGTVELTGGTTRVVGPWFAALAVREVSICAADSDIQDEVEVLVEGRVVTAACPWVVVLEVTSLSEALRLHVDVEDDIVDVINVGEKSVLSPDQAIGVHAIREMGSLRVGVSGLVVGVLVPCRSPMESGSESLVVVVTVVTARLHQVDLS